VGATLVRNERCAYSKRSV